MQLFSCLFDATHFGSFYKCIITQSKYSKKAIIVQRKDYKVIYSKVEVD